METTVLLRHLQKLVLRIECRHLKPCVSNQQRRCVASGVNRLSTLTIADSYNTTDPTNAVIPAETKSLLRKENSYPPSKELNFEVFKNGLQAKSVWELVRALAVLQLSASNFMVDHSLQLLSLGEQILGKTLFQKLMKATVYGQFVAGDCPEAVLSTAQKLQTAGINAFLGIPMEENAGEASGDHKYDMNMRKVLHSADLCTQLNTRYPMMHLKLTGLMPADLCVKISTLIPEPTQKPEVIEQIAKCFANLNEASIKGLSSEETLLLNKGMDRFRKVAQVAEKKGVMVFVDAEYTRMNPALNLITLAAMLHYNIKRPCIAYTYQNYLKAAYKNVCADIDFLKGHGVCFGAKMVRGAYMDAERRQAKQNGLSDPVCEDFDSTSAMYCRSVNKAMELVVKDSSRFNVMVASQNEQTILWAIQRMKELDLDCHDGSVMFAQIMGMADHVTYGLGLAGYPVSKSLPYGSVEETLPYLSRRAMENRSVLQGARKERELMWSTLVDRVKHSLWNTAIPAGQIKHAT